MNTDKRKERTRKMVVTALLGAVSIVLGLTPIGMIPLPMANATTMHIPVIIGAILEGPVVGMIVGAIFGIFSLLKALIAPTSILSPFLLNPLVSVVPRILIGLVAAWLYRGIFRIAAGKKALSPARERAADSVAAAVAAAGATAVNTAGVLGLLALIYAPQYAQAANVPPETVGYVIWGIFMTNGVPEIIVAVILTVAIVRILKRVTGRNGAVTPKKAEKTEKHRSCP
ncbi:MAG: ECF transporter S component [Christensenellales bacterium]|jgi:uncharacterized membrane protein